MRKRDIDNVRAFQKNSPQQVEIPENIQTEYVAITPAMAQEFLKHNVRNVPLQTAMVERYAEKMRTGRWKFCADPIRFDTKGNLIDGQHRLTACVSAGVPFSALIVRGLDPGVMDVIDTGRKRSAGNILYLRGYPSPHYIAAVCRWLLMIKGGGPNLRNSRSIDSTDIVETSLRHTHIIDSVNFCHNCFGGGRLSLLTALHYIGTNLMDKSAEAEGFVTVFKDGTPAYQGDPAMAWREHCLRARNTGAQMFWSLVYPNTVEAFNRTIAGDVVLGKWRLQHGNRTIDGLDLDKI